MLKIGTVVLTGNEAIIPNTKGIIKGYATDDYPGTTEYFIVDFDLADTDNIGTCTVHKDDMVVFVDNGNKR